jgi:hypothetical protein
MKVILKTYSPYNDDAIFIDESNNRFLFDSPYIIPDSIIPISNNQIGGLFEHSLVFNKEFNNIDELKLFLCELYISNIENNDSLVYNNILKELGKSKINKI